MSLSLRQREETEKRGLLVGYLFSDREVFSLLPPSRFPLFSIPGIATSASAQVCSGKQKEITRIGFTSDSFPEPGVHTHPRMQDDVEGEHQTKQGEKKMVGDVVE